jgi:hypothetical protein
VHEPPIVPGVPLVASRNLRRSLIIASCVGAVSLIATGLLGHVLAGIFACLGIALGAGNTWLVQRSVVTYSASEVTNKKSLFAKNVLGRLAIITVIAIGLALLVRPDGLGVMCGLAVFQMIMIGGATVPVYKQLKHEAS